MSSISWAEILRASLEKAVHVRSTVRGPCRRVLLDIRYLVRHSIPNWSGRLPLNPVQRPRTTFFYFSCVIVDRLSYLIIFYKPRCRMRAKKGEREREKGSKSTHISRLLLILRWNYGKTRELFTPFLFSLIFSFQSNSSTLIDPYTFHEWNEISECGIQFDFLDSNKFTDIRRRREKPIKNESRISELIS